MKRKCWATVSGTTMAKSKPARWTCSECGAHGEAPTKLIARAMFEGHWGAWHNTVPWMDDDE